ncbi:MAG: 6-phosphogluconolactonase [Elusimicrobiota bacterium]
MTAILRVLPDAATLALAAAGEFTRVASASKGPFRVALSGGSTPKAFHALLADEKKPFRARIPWERLRFFWGDERCVPPDHPDSNYRMAVESLLSQVPVPPEHVHRMLAEMPDAEKAADLYEETLLREFDGLPLFDWIFLGMGPDGHTASLFPGTTAVMEQKKLVTSVWVDAKASRRVTLTLPVLNAAKKVVFVVAGADKAEAARQVIEGGPQPAFPASLVNPARGELLRLLDRDAAARLTSGV